MRIIMRIHHLTSYMHLRVNQRFMCVPHSVLPCITYHKVQLLSMKQNMFWAEHFVDDFGSFNHSKKGHNPIKQFFATWLGRIYVCRHSLCLVKRYGDEIFVVLVNLWNKKLTVFYKDSNDLFFEGRAFKYVWWKLDCIRTYMLWFWYTEFLKLYTCIIPTYTC